MPAENDLGKMIGGLSETQSHQGQQFTGPGVNIVERFEFYTDKFVLEDSGLSIQRRDIGSGFILGHPTLSILGAGSNYLGDNKGTWITETLVGLEI